MVTPEANNKMLTLSADSIKEKSENLLDQASKWKISLFKKRLKIKMDTL